MKNNLITFIVISFILLTIVPPTPSVFRGLEALFIILELVKLVRELTKEK